MLGRDQANDIFDKLRRLSQADEIELLISGGRSALTRFANNTIHQNVAEEEYHISVRSAFGNRTARASTNKHDDDSLRRVVQSSEALAKVQHPDPDLLPMPTKEEVGAAAVDCADGPVNRYFEATARLTPQDRAEGVASMVNVAKRHNLTAAGIFSSAEIVEGIFNSKGVAGWYEQTLAEVSVSMLDSSSSGWQKANSPDRARLDPVRMAEVAAAKAIESKNPRDLPPGKYTVILEPAAVLDIVGFMFWDFGGSALLEQRSFLNDRIGTRLFGENITVWDDVYHPLQAGVPFDGEGMSRQRLKLIENGVVRAVTYSRSSAKRMQASEKAGRGILVTRLWYIREVEPYEKILTGMTRDGTFLLENGNVVCGIRNFRFNESLLHMLQNVEVMGTPVRSCGEESFDMVAPPMKVRDFNFTETTKF